VQTRSMVLTRRPCCLVLVFVPRTLLVVPISVLVPLLDQLRPHLPATPSFWRGDTRVGLQCYGPCFSIACFICMFYCKLFCLGWGDGAGDWRHLMLFRRRLPCPALPILSHIDPKLISLIGPPSTALFHCMFCSSVPRLYSDVYVLTSAVLIAMPARSHRAAA